MWTIKTQRANEHLQELTQEVTSFFDSIPYKVGTKVDPSSRKLIYYVQNAEDPPEKVALLAGDVIQNLRSALDQLAYQLFMKNSGGIGSVRNIYFPIAKDFSSYEARKQSDTNGMSVTAKALIDEIKPYKGGNDTLWQIQELNIIDKHRALVTVGSSFQSLDIGANMSAVMKESFPDKDIPSFSLFLKPADILFPLATGKELFFDAPDAKPNPEMQFRFNIVLNEPDIIEGEPIIEALQAMVSEVESLESLFRTELQ